MSDAAPEAPPTASAPAPVHEPFPNPRPLVLDKVLEWAAAMWLRDNPAEDEHVFIGLAENAFERAAETQLPMTD